MPETFVSNLFEGFFDGVLEIQGSPKEVLNHMNDMILRGYDKRRIEVFEWCDGFNYNEYSDDGEVLSLEDLEELI